MGLNLPLDLALDKGQLIHAFKGTISAAIIQLRDCTKKARQWNGGPFKSNGSITSSVQPGCLQAALPELGLLVLLVLPLALGLWLCSRP
jgi:hypothetical protein